MADPTSTSPQTSQPAGSLGPCPICGRPAEPKHRPFCSIRCADADLGRWLTGQYRVPGPLLDPDDPDLQHGLPDRSAGGRLDPDDGLG